MLSRCVANGKPQNYTKLVKGAEKLKLHIKKIRTGSGFLKLPKLIFKNRRSQMKRWSRMEQKVLKAVLLLRRFGNKYQTKEDS